ncbi:MAG: biopolymer transporter ExbD [Pseudomonadota bacterium]|nr:biopolymer transporter ExbD [Pseudomonadota bacterium]
MLIWQDEPRKRARIEIVPMIDVMMFLLVFFVLISLHVIPALGIKTQLPSSAQPEKLEIRKHVVVTIGKNGQIQLDGADYTLAGLRSALTEIRRQSRDIDVVVNGDRDASVQQLVDAMDAVKSSGITSIAIASTRQGG